MTPEEHQAHLRHYDEVLAAEDEVLAQLRQAASQGLPEGEVEERIRAYHEGYRSSIISLDQAPLLGQMCFELYEE